MQDRVILLELLNWVNIDLKLDGYEHQVIIDKINSLMSKHYQEDEEMKDWDVTLNDGLENEPDWNFRLNEYKEQEAQDFKWLNLLLNQDKKDNIKEDGRKY